MVENNFSITNETKSTLQSVPFGTIKNEVLGENYDLSLVFVDEKKSHELNKTYREKDRATNVLSFPLDDTTGEIFICPTVAEKEGHSVGFLFIHGLLHLKGLDHGDTMERAEVKLRKKFGV